MTSLKKVIFFLLTIFLGSFGQTVAADEILLIRSLRGPVDYGKVLNSLSLPLCRSFYMSIDSFPWPPDGKRCRDAITKVIAQNPAAFGPQASFQDAATTMLKMVLAGCVSSTQNKDRRASCFREAGTLLSGDRPSSINIKCQRSLNNEALAQCYEAELNKDLIALRKPVPEGEQAEFEFVKQICVRVNQMDKADHQQLLLTNNDFLLTLKNIANDLEDESDKSSAAGLTFTNSCENFGFNIVKQAFDNPRGFTEDTAHLHALASKVTAQLCYYYLFPPAKNKYAADKDDPFYEPTKSHCFEKGSEVLGRISTKGMRIDSVDPHECDQDPPSSRCLFEARYNEWSQLEVSEGAATKAAAALR